MPPGLAFRRRCRLDAHAYERLADPRGMAAKVLSVINHSAPSAPALDCDRSWRLEGLRWGHSRQAGPANVALAMMIRTPFDSSHE
jgi:hypothetical protein